VLEVWANTESTPPRLRTRSRIILRAAEGATNSVIAGELGLTPATVSLWRHRFAVLRLEGIRQDAPRGNGSRHPWDELEARIVQATLRIPPPEGGRWSTRSLARFLSVNHMKVYRAWKAHGLLGRFPDLDSEKPPPPPSVDVVGVFRCPPVRAVVFAIDASAKPSPQPGNGETAPEEPPSPLPRLVRISMPGTLELEWELNELSAFVPERTIPLAAPEDLLIFLRGLKRLARPTDRFHVVVERLDAETRRRLDGWTARSPRFEVEVVAGPVEWDGAVARFLRQWRGDRITRHSFRGVVELTEAFLRLAAATRAPEPSFVWTAPREPPALTAPKGPDPRRERVSPPR
jgi:hypothetical protein